MDKLAKLKLFAWGLSLGVAVVAVAGWGQQLRWQLGGISSYKLFPLFGLLAFSLMWSHYIISAVRQYLNIEKSQLKNYIETTSMGVLAALALHPGLLVWQLWRDGFGLPPSSYLQNYVAPTLRWVAVLGSISLFIFFAYELRRIYSDRSWWKYVVYATDAAMVAIFVHSLNLGSTLKNSWLGTLWYVYAALFAAALGYIYYKKFTSSNP